MSTNQPTAYQTIVRPGEETLIIKKSRFIGYARPVETEAEAISFIESIRKKNPEANHNCYAYQLGLHDEIQKASDDGEPSGTAGRPILEVIKKEALKNVVVVVTRYFGGIMLGGGGLVRAYGQAGGAAIHTAGIATRQLFQRVEVLIDYSWLGKVENETLGAGYFVERTEYSDLVTFFALVPSEDTANYLKLITNATSGQAVLNLDDMIYAFVKDGKLVTGDK